MAATTDTRPLTWQDVINDPSLQDLPYKIELNKRGNIEMSPATNLHGLYQVSIGDLPQREDASPNAALKLETE
jgi:hypothetical protein